MAVEKVAEKSCEFAKTKKNLYISDCNMPNFGQKQE